MSAFAYVKVPEGNVLGLWETGPSRERSTHHGQAGANNRLGHLDIFGVPVEFSLKRLRCPLARLVRVGGVSTQAEGLSSLSLVTGYSRGRSCRRWKSGQGASALLTAQQ